MTESCHEQFFISVTAVTDLRDLRAFSSNFRSPPISISSAQPEVIAITEESAPHRHIDSRAANFHYGEIFHGLCNYRCLHQRCPLR